MSSSMQDDVDDITRRFRDLTQKKSNSIKESAREEFVKTKNREKFNLELFRAKLFDELYNKMQIRYGDLKKQLAEDMISFTTPFREKITELSKDETTISKVVRLGAEKARASAAATVNEARKAIGIRSF